MIVKKRKKKGNKKSKGLKKPHNPNLTSLKSLHLNHKLNKEEGENVQLTIIKKEDKSKKFLNLVVYINEFDRIDEEGKQKCRNNDCENLICKPFRKYCSRKCSKEFTKWYNKNFYWRNIRNSVLKRDNYTCQICGLKLNKKKRLNKKIENWLECDHIIPKSYYTFLGYNFDTLENKIRTVLEFFHNENNLRTLCYKCHKQVTISNLKTKALLIDVDDNK
jgi:5-methylcytosine-specific restriction endonuclease McrA